MRREILLILCFLFLVTIFSFATQFGTVTANPQYLLPGNVVKIVVSLNSTNDVKNVLLNIFYDEATHTLYNPTVHGKNYVWNYTTPRTPYDFHIQSESTFNSTSSERFSNVATFSTDIPAASVNSTIVYVPFIENATKTWEIDAKNIGSKPLRFTAFSSPSGLSILPGNGFIQPQNVEKFKLSNSGFLLPGHLYVLDAFLNTNDPRKGMDRYLLSSIIEGPDGLVVTPVSISHSRVSVGSDVKFGFSVFHHNVIIDYIYAFWNKPNGSKTFILSTTKDLVSSIIRTNSVGTYRLSRIIIGYTYKGTRKELTLNPNLQVKAVSSQKTMDLSLSNEALDVGISINSSSTPDVHALDGTLRKKISMIEEGTRWVGTYSYNNTPGPVTIYATFDDVNYEISKTFERFMVNGEAYIHFDNGWVSIPVKTFEAPTMISIFSEPLSESSYYYKGYSNFNRVSNAVTLASTSEMLASATYHLQFNVSMVNGLLDNLRVYELRGKDWKLSNSTPTVDDNVVSFSAKKGTYALGLIPQISVFSNPDIKSFIIVPRKTVNSKNIQFFLSVDKDCYYHLMIYDMRGRIVASQKGEALRKVANLLYTLNPVGYSNGMYIAVIGVGPSSGELTGSFSKSFAIVR